MPLDARGLREAALLVRLAARSSSVAYLAARAEAIGLSLLRLCESLDLERARQLCSTGPFVDASDETVAVWRLLETVDHLSNPAPKIEPWDSIFEDAEAEAFLAWSRTHALGYDRVPMSCGMAAIFLSWARDVGLRDDQVLGALAFTAEHTTFWTLVVDSAVRGHPQEAAACNLEMAPQPTFDGDAGRALVIAAMRALEQELACNQITSTLKTDGVLITRALSSAIVDLTVPHDAAGALQRNGVDASDLTSLLERRRKSNDLVRVFGSHKRLVQARDDLSEAWAKRSAQSLLGARIRRDEARVAVERADNDYQITLRYAYDQASWPDIVSDLGTSVGGRVVQPYLGGLWKEALAAVGRTDVMRIPHRDLTLRPSLDRTPVFLPCADHRPRVLIPGAGWGAAQAIALARGMIGARMSRALPRMLRLTWMDPLGRGASAGAFLELLEIDKTLIDDQVWYEPDDIARALRRTTDRMAYLEQRCLKNRFATLDDYNAEAGSLAEPYHVLAVTGYPQGFTQESADRLRQITETGARLGITTLVVVDEKDDASTHASPVPGGWIVDRRYARTPLLRPEVHPLGDLILAISGTLHAPIRDETKHCVVHVRADDKELLEFDSAEIVEAYGHATQTAGNVSIDAAGLIDRRPDSPDRSTVEDIRLPLGRMGRGEVISLVLGRGLHQNALIGGLPGSGKSTLFHTLITAAVRRYAPSEVELYLLDFKQGVEFQPYANGALPHARVVGVQSEREFGLSTLRDLSAAIDRRAELFRGPEGKGADSLTEYRTRTGQPLARILLLIDEFQVIFSEDDALAHEAARLLDRIVRQGRAFGVHTVLGTQTLRGHGALSLLRGTLDQIAVRIALKTSEADSRLFLAEDNDAGVRLTRPGEAVFNDDAGRTQGNVVFQVGVTSDDDRDEAIRAAREDADRLGDARRPVVFDGTRDVAPETDPAVQRALESTASPTTASTAPCQLIVGSPIGVAGSGAVTLARAAGQHVLFVSRNREHALGSLVVGLLTQSGGPRAATTVIDCLGIDEELGDLLCGAASTMPATVCGRRRELVGALRRMAEETQRRIDADEYVGPRLLLVIAGLHRARELGDSGYGEAGSPLADLQLLLKEGADVGVHVIVVAESLDLVERRIGHGALGMFGVRVVGQCSAEASHRLVGRDTASRLGDRYVLISEPDEDRLEKVRAFPPPDPDWLATVLGSQGSVR